jgi:hypothetical protein
LWRAFCPAKHNPRNSRDHRSRLQRHSQSVIL